MKIIGFQYSTTGIFGYMFYHSNNKICTTSSLVMPSPPVYICGFGEKWISPFNQDSTIFPGLIRYVYHTDSGREACHIEYTGKGYHLYLGSNTYEVKTADEVYAFHSNKQQIASITQIPRQETKNSSITSNISFDDMKAYYSVDVTEGISGKLLIMILAFPMIRF